MTSDVQKKIDRYTPSAIEAKWRERLASSGLHDTEKAPIVPVNIFDGRRIWRPFFFSAWNFSKRFRCLFIHTEAIMFQQTLLESSPAARKHARWPMATSFTLQIIAAGVLVIVPLLSTGMIPFSSHLTVVASTRAPAHADAQRQGTGAPPVV